MQEDVCRYDHTTVRLSGTHHALLGWTGHGRERGTLNVDDFAALRLAILWAV
jgi:hypothetical protein